MKLMPLIERKPAILLPKEGSWLWPVTEYALKQAGIRYETGSRNYRIDAGDVEFFLGKPQDWETALVQDADAAVTGYDLLVDSVCRSQYVVPKRAAALLKDLPRNEKKAAAFVQKWLQQDGAQYTPVYRDWYCGNGYTFADARALNGLPTYEAIDQTNLTPPVAAALLRGRETPETKQRTQTKPYAVLKLDAGKGIVALMDRLPDGGWSPDEIGCAADYRNLAELWLDENYTSSDMCGYQLVPYRGSVEGTNLSPVIDFVKTGETAKANRRTVTNTMLVSQAVVVYLEEAGALVRELFDGMLVS